MATDTWTCAPHQLSDADLSGEITAIEQTVSIMPEDDGRLPGYRERLQALRVEHGERVSRRLAAAERDSRSYPEPYYP